MSERAFLAEIDAASLAAASSRAMGREDEHEEAAYVGFMRGLRLEPSQLITAQPEREAEEDRAYAAFIRAMGATPWSAERP